MYHPEVEDRVSLTKYFAKLGFKIGAEIGVAKGKFSRVICWNVPNVKLYCIDPYKTDPNDPADYGNAHEIHYEWAKKILKPYNVEFILKNSKDALEDFKDESLDFVYIDANHSFDYVIRDIIEWSKKVRSGGIISGHDYYNFGDKFDVPGAVDAYVKSHKLTAYLTKDRVHSYFWIKP